MTTQETARKTLMESWGFAVTLIDDDDTQANFDSAAADNSAAFISQEALATSVGTKLTSKTIGVVNENKDMVDDLGFVTGLSIGGGLPTMNVDSSHYITSVFTINPVSVYAATEWYMIYDIPVATGVYQLGKWAESPWADRPALMTLCQGGSIIGGGTAAGRRVQLPWGSGQGATPVDINNSLTDDGRTITKRAIEWAAGSGVCPNMPPTVDAGLDQDLTFPTVKASLDGTVTDDNLPDPPDTVTTTWSQVSGPAGVTFDDDSQVDTVAKFPGLGTYVLRLTADDSALAVFDELTVEVAGVAFENFSETSNSTKGVVIDIDRPSGTAVGDLLIAAVATNGDTESALSPP
ncbi:MAG: hypothetical protein GY732_17470, partial [Gammaproteobacteria bacterium]|nr:hypothetical protein [Gammaproteobacteria bacterium]